MTQKIMNLAQAAQNFFSMNPAIAQGYARGLINRRALARHIAKSMDISISRIEALNTALRRTEFSLDEQTGKKIFAHITMRTKDSISILNINKTEQAITRVQEMMKSFAPVADQTLKVVVGTQSIKVFIDTREQTSLVKLFPRKDMIDVRTNVSEISLIFSEKAGGTPGIISTVTTELTIAKVNIMEMLSCTPELLLYIAPSDLVTTIETISRLKE